MDVFISFAEKDKDLIDELEETLRNGGCREIWRYDYGMVGGREWDPQIKSNLEKCKTFMFVMTENSLKSKYCQKELQHAALLDKPIVPVVFNKDISIPHPLNSIQYVLFDQSPVSGAKLTHALQNPKPLNREEIPSDWKTWDGKSKKELLTPQDDFLETPLPELKRNLTDIEKQDFLDDSLPKICNYFKRALSVLEKSDTRIKCRIRDKSDSDFTCQIFLDGKLEKSCRIWINSSIGLNGIAYREATGQTTYGKIGGCNELLVVSELHGKPALEFTFNVLMSARTSDCQICTVEEASERLWAYFIRYLNQESEYW